MFRIIQGANLHSRKLSSGAAYSLFGFLAATIRKIDFRAKPGTIGSLKQGFVLLPVVLLVLLSTVTEVRAFSASIVSQAAGEIPLRASATADSVQAGGLFELQISVISNEIRILSVPDSTLFSRDFELRSSTLTDSLLTLQLQFFGNEDTRLDGLHLPVFSVARGDTFKGNVPAVQLYFKSSLTDDADLRPLKPLFVFPASLFGFILMAALLIALAAVAYFLYKRFFKKAQIQQIEPQTVSPPPQFENPFNTLLKELSLIHSNISVGKIGPAESCMRTGDALRAYFSAVYQFPSLEQTSRETLQELDNRQFNKKLLEQIQTIFKEADLIKFARYSISNSRAIECVETALQVAHQLKARDSHRIQQLQLTYYEQIKQSQLQSQSQPDNSQKGDAS
ncbi:MAG: hypothetical protein LAT67_10845 [Balneolales bacterium]|nr:hypothetical protein [Balneolales bacterium]